MSACLVKAVEDLKKISETFRLTFDQALVVELRTPSLASYFECLFVSLLSDPDLAASDKRKRLENGFSKLESYEKSLGANSIQLLMHKVIRTEAASFVCGRTAG